MTDELFDNPFARVLWNAAQAKAGKRTAYEIENGLACRRPEPLTRRQLRDDWRNFKSHYVARYPTEAQVLRDINRKPDNVIAFPAVSGAVLQCMACGDTRRLEAFGPDARNPGRYGRRSYCRDCEREGRQRQRKGAA